MNKILLSLLMFIITSGGMLYANSIDQVNIAAIFATPDTDLRMNGRAVEENFRQYWKDIEEDPFFEIVTPTVIKGGDYGRKLDAKINSILALPKEIRAKTVVYVHIYDHGITSGGRLPILGVTRSKYDSEKKILDRLKNKVKLLVLFVDACNSIDPTPGRSNPQPYPGSVKKSSITASDLVSNQYLKPLKAERKHKKSKYQLWMSNGYLAIVSSRVGQKAKYHSALGGYASYLFYVALNVFKDQERQNWLDILHTFSNNTTEVVWDNHIEYQHPIWFGNINGQKLATDHTFFPITDTLSRKEKIEYLKRFKNDNLISLINKANLKVEEFCNYANKEDKGRQGFNAPEFDKITISDKKFPFYDVPRFRYRLLRDYKRRYSIRDGSFLTDSITYLGIFEDNSLRRKEILLFKVLKEVQMRGKVQKDTLEQLIGVEIDRKLVSLKKENTRIRVNRVINYPKEPQPPAIKEIAHEKSNVLILSKLDEYENWLKFISNNYRDAMTLDSATTMAESLFHDIDSDTISTSEFNLYSINDKTSIMTPKQFVNLAYDDFNKKYENGVEYEFYQDSESGKSQDFEEVEKNKRWIGYVSLRQVFNGITENYDIATDFGTVKKIEFIMEYVGDELGEPIFDCKIKSINTIPSEISVEQLAKDHFENNYLIILQQYYAILDTIASSYKVGQIETVAYNLSKEIFINPNTDTLQTSVVQADTTIQINKGTVKQQISNMIKIFEKNYESVEYVFCYEILRLDDENDRGIYFKETKENSTWESQIIFSQVFKGKTKKGDALKYFDRTNKSVVFEIVWINPETGELPKFEAKIKSINVLGTKKEDSCLERLVKP
jgi:hypothetical protein